MIDFACKKFDLEEVIRCGLTLTKIEFNIVKFLLKQNRKIGTREISIKLNIGLSTAQKAIKKIKDKGLIKQSQKNLEKGGYIFVYSIEGKNIIKEKILEIIHNWIIKVEKEMRKW